MSAWNCVCRIIIVREPSVHLVERGRRWGLHASHLAVTEGDGQSCMGGLGWHFLASPPTDK